MLKHDAKRRRTYLERNGDHNDIVNLHKYTWLVVFSFLDAPSLLTAQHVCTLWDELIIRNFIWKQLFLQDFSTFHPETTTPITIPTPMTSTGPISGAVNLLSPPPPLSIPVGYSAPTPTLPSVLTLHKPIDAPDLEWKDLYKLRYLHSRKYITCFPKDAFNVLSKEDTLCLENRGSRPSFGLYAYTKGVCMNQPFGHSRWLLMLGFKANYYEVAVTGGASVGLTSRVGPKGMDPGQHLGWDSISIGFHTDDGTLQYREGSNITVMRGLRKLGAGIFHLEWGTGFCGPLEEDISRSEEDTHGEVAGPVPCCGGTGFWRQDKN